jgi:hypothetical protein
VPLLGLSLIFCVCAAFCFSQGLAKPVPLLLELADILHLCSGFRSRLSFSPKKALQSLCLWLELADILASVRLGLPQPLELLSQEGLP